MKPILLISVLLICLQSTSQNRFEKEFAEADSVFYSKAEPKTVNDSIPEMIMRKAFDNLFKARKELEKAIKAYQRRDLDVKGDKYNAINCKAALKQLAYAYNELSAIWEKMKDDKLIGTSK